MTNFIYNNTTVPINKMNAAPLPPGANPAQWGVASEWITLCQALLDIQGWARGAQWMGYTPLATDPAPAGVADYIWLRTDGALMHNGTPFSGGGGVTSVATGTGLTGGPITTTGTISLANTAVTPGTYNSATLTVDAQGRVTAAAGGVVKEQSAPVNGPSPSMQFQALGVNPAGTRVYVGSQAGPEVWHFSTATNLWDTTAPAAIPLNYAAGFVFNATGTKMYVTLLTSPNAVYIVDTATNLITGTITGLPPGAYGTMALQPGTNELWVHNNSGPGSIMRVNTTLDAYITSFPAATYNAYGMTFNPSGTKMYYVGANTLVFAPRFHIYDAVLYTLITSVSDTPLYRGIVALPDGSEVWVSVDGSFPVNSTLVRYSTVTDAIVGTPILTSQDALAPAHIKAKSDSSKVYALLTSGDIDVVTVSSHTITNTIAMSGDYAGDLVINPASTFLYASKTQGTQPYWVKVIDIATELVTTTIESGSVAQPAPTTVGSFNALRIVGGHVTNDGGGQGAITLPLVFDTGANPRSNIKANRPSFQASVVDQTKTGITNFGVGSTASGNNATVGGGTRNVASGNESTVPGGDANVASGVSSFASGNGSLASGDYSTAMGGSQASANFATALCEANASGVASLAVNDGSAASGVGSFAANQSQARAAYSCAEGFGFVDTGSTASHAEGSGYVDTGCLESHAEGRNSYVWPGVRGGHAEGNNCQVKFDAGHAEGDSCVAGNYYAHAQNVGCHAMGDAAHAEGNGCYANGWYSHAQGGATTADGEGSHAEGDGTRAIGKWSHAQGSAAKALRETQFAYSSGSDNYTGGRHQTSWLTARGTTGGGAPNESVVLQYGISSDLADIALEDGKAYAFKIVVVAGGVQAGPVRRSRSIEIKFNARRDAGLTVITASGVGDAYGDASTATWTLTPTVGVGPDRILLTFNTGAGVASACGVVARVEFVETVY